MYRRDYEPLIRSQRPDATAGERLCARALLVELRQEARRLDAALRGGWMTGRR